MLKLNTNSLPTPNTSDKLCFLLKGENTECGASEKKPKTNPQDHPCYIPKPITIFNNNEMLKEAGAKNYQNSTPSLLRSQGLLSPE